MRECYFAVKDARIRRRHLLQNQQKIEEVRVDHHREIEIIGFLFH